MAGGPNMSDANLLLTVEDLINISMGPITENRVNFKVLQTVLHILARQLRMLEVKVEIRPETPAHKKKRKSRRKDTRGSAQRKHGKGKHSTRSKKKDRSPSSPGKESEGDREEKEGSSPERGSPRKKKLRKGSGKKEKTRGSSEDDDKSEEEELGGKPGDAAGEHKDSDTVHKYEKKVRKSIRDADGGSEISITEVGRGKEKVLVVEPGRGRESGKPVRVGSVEVVSRSDFDSLAGSVRDLQTLAGPIPAPSMPDNQRLRADLAKGSATLPAAMQNMQISARVDATEQALLRLIAMLTTMVTSGAMPRELAEKAQLLLRETIGGNSQLDFGKGQLRRGSRPPRNLMGIDNATLTPYGNLTTEGLVDEEFEFGGVGSTDCITQPELDEALLNLREEMEKMTNEVLAKLYAANDAATKSAQALADKMEQTRHLEEQLAMMGDLVQDYNAQLDGLQDAFQTQITCFEDQMSQVKSDLVGGLKQMENATGNTETAAVIELNERYEELLQALETANTTNEALHTYQNSLEEQLRKLMETIQVLQEQKNDRDELIDGLRDKADVSRLVGLLREDAFLLVKEDLELKITLFHDKFMALDLIWEEALKNLSHENEQKAELFQLESTKDELERYLKELEEKIKQLAMVVGEPEAAILTRKLAKDGLCGACMVPAHMWPTATDRPPAVGAEGEPCWMPVPHDTRTHVCHRWCGGSHTLLGGPRVRPDIRAAPEHEPVSGFGDDGRMYMFEAEPQPCKECNDLEVTPVKLLN